MSTTGQAYESLDRQHIQASSQSLARFNSEVRDAAVQTHTHIGNPALPLIAEQKSNTEVARSSGAAARKGRIEMDFLDSHCHLDHPLFAADLEAVIARMRQSQTVAVTHGTCAQSNQRQLALADLYPDVLKAACGLDPFHAAKEDLEAHLDFLEHNKKHLTAVGEIGLDLHYFSRETLTRQKEVFEAQLAFAEKHQLASVIHTRKAVLEVLQILPSFKGIHVLHFFLEKKHVQAALDAGCYLSLPTIKSKNRTAIIRSAPLDRLLAETDAPYGLAAREKGKKPGRNEPINVRQVYEAIAEDKKQALSDVQTQLLENAKNVFKI